jgi:hypothetical protein
MLNILHSPLCKEVTRVDYEYSRCPVQQGADNCYQEVLRLMWCIGHCLYNSESNPVCFLHRLKHLTP